MNVSRWGPSAWTVLHGLSDRLPAILSKGQVDFLVDLSRQLESVLPCIYCRQSYSQFYQEVPLERILTYNRPYRILWDWWIWVIHNKVNRKLERAHYGFAGLDRSFYRHKTDPEWRAACWDFLFTLGFNYDRQKAGVYREFFGPCFSQLLKETQLIQEPLSVSFDGHCLKSREDLVAWLFLINQTCARQPCEPLTQLCQRYESNRAKTCSKKGCH